MQRRLSLLAMLLMFAFSADAALVTVSPSSLGAWRTGGRGGHCNLIPLVATSSLSFVPGGNPPLGRGSLQLTIGSNGTSYIYFVGKILSGVPLGNITQLAYSTHIDFAREHEFSQQAPTFHLSIELAGESPSIDELIFEPRLNGTVRLGEWQTWDALAGVWYSISVGANGPRMTLANYLAAHPGARIRSDVTVDTGFRAGCRLGDWTSFSGRIDAVNIGVNGLVTTYDFDPDPGRRRSTRATSDEE